MLGWSWTFAFWTSLMRPPLSGNPITAATPTAGWMSSCLHHRTRRQFASANAQVPEDVANVVLETLQQRLQPSGSKHLNGPATLSRQDSTTSTAAGSPP